MASLLLWIPIFPCYQPTHTWLYGICLSISMFFSFFFSWTLSPLVGDALFRHERCLMAVLIDLVFQTWYSFVYLDIIYLHCPCPGFHLFCVGYASLHTVHLAHNASINSMYIIYSSLHFLTSLWKAYFQMLFTPDEDLFSSNASSCHFLLHPHEAIRLLACDLWTFFRDFMTYICFAFCVYLCLKHFIVFEPRFLVCGSLFSENLINWVLLYDCHVIVLISISTSHVL